jgi:hypothetical protein
MDDQEEDNCTATNLSTDDNVELRGIVSKLVASAGGDALALFTRFYKLVREITTTPVNIYVKSSQWYMPITELNIYLHSHTELVDHSLSRTTSTT